MSPEWANVRPSDLVALVRAKSPWYSRMLRAKGIRPAVVRVLLASPAETYETLSRACEGDWSRVYVKDSHFEVQ